MRKLSIALGVIVVVVIAALGIFAASFDINRYRSAIQSELSRKLGRNVTLGEMHLNLFPPRFRVQDVTIGDDPRLNTDKPFVQAQKLNVSVKLLPLLGKSIEINSLYLQRPSVELIKNQQGVWNFASLGQQESSSGHGQLSLTELVIQDGEIATTDRQRRSVYDHIDVTLRDFTPDQPFSIDAAAHLPGAGTQEVRLQGKGGPIRKDQPAATPFHGTLGLKQVEIDSFERFIHSAALNKIDGKLSGQTNVTSASGKLSADGQMTLQNARVNGRDLGYSISAQYNISDNVSADMLTIQNATLKLGTTPLVINGTVDSKPVPAQILLNIRTNGVSMVEAAKLAAASGVVFAPGTTVTGTLSANLQARGAANNPALSGTINGRDVQVSGKEVPQPVLVKAVDLALTPADIRSDTFTVTSGGTAINVQFALRQYLSNTPVIDATLRAPNAELPAVFAMAKAYGAKSLDKISGAGTLNVDLHAAGPVRSIASAEVARALNGALNLSAHDVHYSGADISHELATVAGLLGVHEKDQGFTSIKRLTGNIVVRNGTAQTKDLQALLDIGNLGLAGTADLVNETLNFRATAVLSKEFSQKVGGMAAGGYLRTALANNQGELVIPVAITGTLQHPHFSPDLQQVAQMKLKGLVPNFDNPAAAVSGLLENFLGRQTGDQAQSQQRSRAQNPLQQLQDLLGNKKKSSNHRRIEARTERDSLGEVHLNLFPPSFVCTM